MAAYFAFRLEISAYWDQLYFSTAIETAPDEDGYQSVQYDYNLLSFKNIWLINYSVIFVVILIWSNIKKINNKFLGLVSLALAVVSVVVFLTVGLYAISELRAAYITRATVEFYDPGIFYLLIRYISLGCFALLVYSCWKLVYAAFMTLSLNKALDYFIHICAIWIASSELITWMDIGGFSNTYKLGLSILWGVYALLLIGLGIWKKKKHLRLGAIGLFAVTLLKVFFYDISHLDTISKTIVFVSLGILLLVISFLYNKYRDLIANEAKT